MTYPRTPDGRYFVVRGRLWRLSDPRIEPRERERLVSELMSARRAVRETRQAGGEALRTARAGVNAAKIALGERGAVWWDDGAPDLNRRMVDTTAYADWYRESIEDGAGE